MKNIIVYVVAGLLFSGLFASADSDSTANEYEIEDVYPQFGFSPEKEGQLDDGGSLINIKFDRNAAPKSIEGLYLYIGSIKVPADSGLDAKYPDEVFFTTPPGLDVDSYGLGCEIGGKKFDVGSRFYVIEADLKPSGIAFWAVGWFVVLALVIWAMYKVTTGKTELDQKF